MQTDDHFATFSKTQKQMYSTMIPLSTPRRRYPQKDQSTTLRRSVFDRTNLEPSQKSATISKDLKEHRRQLNASNLPELKKPKAFMLQQWLNQALEGGGEVDINPNNQALKTLKKYSLDKGNLRNFNLSFQTIQRLHTTLFIYSQGIKNIFGQMLSQASSGGNNDNSLPKLYFKVFLKLLQNIMPIKTCFHMIQQSLKKQISELKKQKNQLLIKVQEQKHNFIAIQNKLKKEIESLENKIKKIMTDYQIMESTLQMYEISFNDEVALRLKFQEKINIAYTCYEELKDKYEALRQQFGYKANALADNNMEQMTIKDQLHSQTLKNDELRKQLQHLQRKVVALEKDLIVKNQEIMDLSLMSRKEVEQKIIEENVIDQLMLRIKILQKQKEDDTNKVKELNEVIGKCQETISKLKNDLAYARDKNDEIYIKYHQKTLQIMPLEKDIYEKQLKISALSKQNSTLITTKTLLSQQLEQTVLQLKEVQNIQMTSNKDIQLYSCHLQKTNATIIQLKDVKDKYQRLNSKLIQELKEARRQVQKKVLEIVESKGKCVDLQFHLSELEKVKNSYEAKIFQLQKQFAKKDQQLDERKGIERKKIREVQSQVLKKDMELQSNKQAYQKLQKQSNFKDNQRMKKIEQISFLRKNTAILQAENKQYKLKINQLKSEAERKESQIQTLKKDLEARNFTILKKRQEIDGQIINLKLRITQLKQKLNYKAQYVHPMVAEDMAQQITHLHNKIHSINQNNAEINRTYHAIKDQLQKKRKEIIQYTEEVNILKQKMDKNDQQLIKVCEEKRKEDQKRSVNQQEIRKNSKQKDKTIELLKNAIKKKEDQAALNIKAVQKMSEELQKFRQQLNRSKNISTEANVQTDCISSEKISTSSQTDNFSINSSTNGRKLTTSDRLRNKLEDPQPSLVQLPIQQKHTEMPTKNQSKPGQQKHYVQDKAEKKVQDREFKAALRLTYMRK